MLRFQDGPAAGVILACRRAPLYLRVVCKPSGEWDVLDQLGDEAALEESLTAYRRTGAAGSVHVCSRGRGGRGCQVYATGEYRVCPVQPDEGTMRDTAKWRAWCVEQVKAVAGEGSHGQEPRPAGPA